MSMTGPDVCGHTLQETNNRPIKSNLPAELQALWFILIQIP